MYVRNDRHGVVHDPHPRVRLEAIVAASWLDTDAAAGVVLESMKQPYDTWMGPVTKSIVDHTLKDNMANLRGSPALNLESNANARAFFRQRECQINGGG